MVGEALGTKGRNLMESSYIKRGKVALSRGEEPTKRIGRKTESNRTKKKESGKKGREKTLQK